MSDTLFDDILADVARAQESVAVEARDEIKRRISVPVDKSTRPWTRSKRGEHPRTESGRLKESVHVETLVTDNVAQASVSTDVFYAPILQLSMDRPITTGVGESMTEMLLNRVADAV